MIDRFFTLALAAGMLALAVSTIVGIVSGPTAVSPRMVHFDRVTISGKRAMAGDLPVAAPFER